MAHKKAAGSTDNGRDSNSKRLGVKLYGGQTARAGNIIIRQRGSKFHLGENTYFGKDWTVHAKIDGEVTYRRGYKNRVFVSIKPSEAVAETAVKPKKAAPKAAATPAAPKKAAAAPKAAAPAAASSAKPDNLTKVEGIGPKIAGLLNDAGITTFAMLASTDASKIKEILTNAGGRYASHNPTTWPTQANLAATGKWDELNKLQDELDGGKPPVTASTEEE